MNKKKFGALEIDPTLNPAVLNTQTWSPDEAASTMMALPESACASLAEQINTNSEKDLDIAVKQYIHSASSCDGSDYVMAGLDDGQNVFLQFGKDSGGNVLEDKLCNRKIGDKNLTVYPVSDKNLHSYFQKVNKHKGPKAMGQVPRLGIGNRHTVALWPGIWEAMHRGNFAANAVQNSVRELSIMEELLSGKPPRVNHLFSVGAVQEGHTGSTFEGLWTYGCASALQSKYTPRYGTDADHLQVKRGSEGIARTKQFLDATKYYTFYTLDVSDILNYSALGTFSAAESSAYIDELIPDSALRKDVLSYHKKRQFIKGVAFEADEATLGRYIAKYWKALDAVEELDQYIASFKNGEAYDLELSIDENPPEVETFETITTVQELLFIVLEIRRRGISVTHLAPNFGVEKAVDYRGDDGLEGLGKRLVMLHAVSDAYGFILDCHSGDDLSESTRKVFGESCRGRLNFKLSPSLQEIYSQVVFDMDPDFFQYWWDDAYNYAKECAESGSPFAKKSLHQYACFEKTPSPYNYFFREYNFATLGRRDKKGQFTDRHRFYSYSEEFQTEMNSRICKWLMKVAEDIYG